MLATENPPKGANLIFRFLGRMGFVDIFGQRIVFNPYGAFQLFDGAH